MHVVTNTAHLFVYGTLRKAIDHPMCRVLERASTLVGEGVVNAVMFDLGDYPGIVLSSHSDDRVVGEVLQLHPAAASHLLRTLDEYEGLGPSGSRPHEYRRQVIDVRGPDGRTVAAWAYVMTDRRPPLARILSGDFTKPNGADSHVPPVTTDTLPLSSPTVAEYARIPIAFGVSVTLVQGPEPVTTMDTETPHLTLKLASPRQILTLIETPEQFAALVGAPAATRVRFACSMRTAFGTSAMWTIRITAL